MGIRAPRICSKCHRMAEPNTTLCAAHKDAKAVADRQRKANNPAPFNPNSKAWRITRNMTLYRFPQCAQVDACGVRCVQLATEAHHIVKATVWMGRGGDYLDQSNLVGLCKVCHTKHTIAERTGTDVLGSFASADQEWSLL